MVKYLGKKIPTQSLFFPFFHSVLSQFSHAFLHIEYLSLSSYRNTDVICTSTNYMEMSLLSSLQAFLYYQCSKKMEIICFPKTL